MGEQWNNLLSDYLRSESTLRLSVGRKALPFTNKLPQTHRRLPWRHRWPEAIRDEALARLLELSKQRAAEERRAGQAAAADDKKKAKRRGSKKDQGSQATLLDVSDTEGSHGE